MSRNIDITVLDLLPPLGLQDGRPARVAMPEHRIGFEGVGQRAPPLEDEIEHLIGVDGWERADDPLVQADVLASQQPAARWDQEPIAFELLGDFLSKAVRPHPTKRRLVVVDAH